jgi:hypothetical protein
MNDLVSVEVLLVVKIMAETGRVISQPHPTSRPPVRAGKEILNR